MSLKNNFSTMPICRSCFRTALSGAILASLLPTAQAANLTCAWISGSGDWEDSTHWSNCGGAFPNNNGNTFDVVKDENSTTTLNQNIGIDSLKLSNGVIRGGFNLTINETLTFDGGAHGGDGGTTTVNGGMQIAGEDDKHLNDGNLINTGATTWAGGRFTNGNSALAGQFTNASSGSFDIQTDADFLRGTFTNEGTLTKSVGSTDGSDTNFFTGTFNNSGTVNAQQGVLEFDGGGTHSGTLSGTENGTIQFGGQSLTHDFNAGTAITGGVTVRVDNGNVSINDPVTAGADSTVELTANGIIRGASDFTVDGQFLFNGGTHGGDGGTTTVNGGMQIGGGEKHLNDGNLINTGATTWAGGRFTNGNSALAGQFTNASSGSFNIQTDADFLRGTFTNGGTLTKSVGATNGSDFNDFTTLNNTGNVDIQVGKLAVSGSMDQQGTIRIAQNAVFSAPNLLNEGLITGSGTVEMTKTGGMLTNNDRVAPGDGVGTLTIDGNYLQADMGVLEIELGGTQDGEFDVLHIIGDFTLDGNVEVSLVDGFIPDRDDIFTILTSDGNRLPVPPGSELSVFDSIISLNPRIEFSAIYGDNFVQLAVSQVPIPAAVWLFGSALLGLFGVSRCNRNN